jgi:hypothetical protein
MSSEMTRAMALLDEEFDFDVVLGGINVDSTQFVNEFGRARLADIWRRVTEVTGTTFGPGLPAGDFVYNSTRACVAVEVVRELTGRAVRVSAPAAGSIFLGAEDVTNPALLIAKPPPWVSTRNGLKRPSIRLKRCVAFATDLLRRRVTAQPHCRVSCSKLPASDGSYPAVT